MGEMHKGDPNLRVPGFYKNKRTEKVRGKTKDQQQQKPVKKSGEDVAKQTFGPAEKSEGEKAPKGVPRGKRVSPTVPYETKKMGAVLARGRGPCRHQSSANQTKNGPKRGLLSRPRRFRNSACTKKTLAKRL